jgi:uncharacterized membrane protein
VTRPRSLLAAGIAAFAGGFAALAILQHLAYRTGRFDLGNLVQAVWSTAHGHLLSVTDLEGRQISRLGAHFDPLVAAFAPLWWIWPDASLLLVGQALAVALGAIPVFLLAQKHVGSDWAGLGFGLAYLLYPATEWLVLDDFHPVALATPLLLLAFWWLDEDRLLRFALAAGLACLTKEHVGLTVAAMGIWYAVSRRRTRAGLAIAAAGVAAAVLAVGVVVPAFAPGDGSPFAGRYAGAGGSPAGIVETAASDPGRVVGEATEARDGRYLLHLLVPLAGLPLLAPLAAATAAPEILANVLSDTPTQASVRYHYTATAIPGLLAAAVLGAGALRRRRRGSAAVSARAAVLAAIAGGILLGPLPVWRHVPLGEQAGARDHLVDEHARIAERLLRLVPPSEPVSAGNTLGAHLSERRRIFSFPVVREATWVVVDTERPSYRDEAVAPRRAPRALERLRASGRWQVVAQEDGVLLLRRR